MRVRGTLPLAIAAALSLSGQEPPEPRFSESVDVERVLLDIRALGPEGRPLPGLEARDFEARVDGRPARVESARWVDGADSGGLDDETRARLEAAGFPTAAPGRLIVFLFQKDLNSSRLPGLIQMKQRAAQMLERLAPDDRVALLSYDSHLRLWLDFGTDRSRLVEALDESVLFGRAVARPASTSTPRHSLWEAFDVAGARRATTIEAGLLVLARALDPLPGAKSLVFFGHGFGALDGSFAREYGAAQQALQAARTTVFSIDVTQADRHTMEVGLEEIAWATGGFYARAFHFPGQALTLVEAALEGHYALILERPAGLRRGRHRVSVSLVGRRGSVLAPPGFEDR